MTFTARAYPDIVADVLTAATQGVVGESVTVPGELGDEDLLFLTSRPVRRVSRVDGVRLGPEGEEVPWRFTDADWELVASTGRPEERDALRFRPRRPRPAPGSTILVSYWPAETPPVPLTDVSIGSVTRTLLETLARELADAEAQLGIVYESAFVETATARSLDRVVALLGITRRRADTPLGKVRLHRRSGTSGLVTVPVGTEVLTAEGARYRTTREVVLQRGETSVEVAVAGLERSTPLVEAGALDRLSQAVAGIDRVGNDAPTHRAATAETDDELRARARRAFHGVGRGTLDALVHGVAGLAGVVSGVEVEERPGGLAGVVRLDVAFVDPDDVDHLALVATTIERLRPAGIRVDWAPAGAVDVALRIERLVLVGSSRPTGEVEAVRTGLTDRLVAALRDLGPGGTLSAARLAAVALADPSIEDVAVSVTVDGTPGLAEVRLPPGATARPLTPLGFPTVEFADTAPAVPTRLEIRLLAPVVLVGTTTLDDAQQTIRGRVEQWLRDRTILSFDTLADAVRDDTAYGLVREDASLVLEADGRFEQLVAGSPDRPLAPGETATLVAVELEERR